MASLVADTEQFALKDPDRYKEKFAKPNSRSSQTKMSANLIARIHDGIRYTFDYDDENYTDGRATRL